MLEMLMNPTKAERKPWEMFFVGVFYASLSILLVTWIFGKDPVLSRYSGILVVTFTVMFSLPFMYYIIKLEERKITSQIKTLSLLQEHEKAIKAMMWLFIGFVVAFSFWYIVLPNSDNFRAQIETYCSINQPGNVENCVSQYGVKNSVRGTGFITNQERLFLIFSNNMYVLMFTLIFSLIFGAGAIFILAWNASVIAAAIKIFTQSSLTALPLGLLRYLIHGIPEIAAYFVVALAGGIVSVAVIRKEYRSEKFWDIMQDALNLVIIAVVLLFVAALIEVYVTPVLF